MIINSAKTKVMLVGTIKKRQRLNKETLDLNFSNDHLSMITNDKILGVFVDNNLTWSEHTNHPTNKMSSNIWLLSKIKVFFFFISSSSSSALYDLHPSTY